MKFHETVKAILPHTCFSSWRISPSHNPYDAFAGLLSIPLKSSLTSKLCGCTIKYSGLSEFLPFSNRRFSSHDFSSRTSFRFAGFSIELLADISKFSVAFLGTTDSESGSITSELCAGNNFSVRISQNYAPWKKHFRGNIHRQLR